MDVRNTIFQAIHTPISFSPNSSGNVLFHNHLTGNASRIDNPKITTTAIVAKPTVLVNVSIIFLRFTNQQIQRSIYCIDESIYVCEACRKQHTPVLVCLIFWISLKYNVRVFIKVNHQSNILGTIFPFSRSQPTF